MFDSAYFHIPSTQIIIMERWQDESGNFCLTRLVQFQNPENNLEDCHISTSTHHPDISKTRTRGYFSIGVSYLYLCACVFCPRCRSMRLVATTYSQSCQYCPTNHATPTLQFPPSSGLSLRSAESLIRDLYCPISRENNVRLRRRASQLSAREQLLPQQ